MTRKKIKKKSKNDVERFIKRNIKNKPLQAVLVLALGAGFFLYNEVYLNSISSSVLVDNQYQKLACVDGDTFKLDNESMRMLAIDTPESVKPNHPVEPFGKEASKFTCELLENATTVDLKQDTGNEVDQYGRKLVWVLVDGVLLQELILEVGLGEIKYVQQ